MTLRPATVADIEAFYGKAAVPLQLLTLDDDGPVAIGGIAWIDGRATAVSWITERAKAAPRAVMRATREVLRMFDQHGGPVYANADEDEPGACRFLERLGFVPEEGCYVYRPDVSRRA